MQFHILTLFPGQVYQFFDKGIMGKALKKSCFQFSVHDLRDYGIGNYKQVDDYPFGHRKGMLLKVDVLDAAIRSIEAYQDYRILYTCPKGPNLTHERVSSMAEAKGLILIAGYYEGIDERLFSLHHIERVSLGSFIMSSGELTALATVDAVARLLPGVLGKSDCVTEESYISGLLECPQFTQPRDYRELAVPEVLLGGHHGKIAVWRRRQALAETLSKRPSLLAQADLTEDDRKTVVELVKEVGHG